MKESTEPEEEMYSIKEKLHYSVSGIIANLGFSSVERRAHTALENLMHLYLRNITFSMKELRMDGSRTDVNMQDLLRTMKYLELDWRDIGTYMDQVEPFAYDYPYAPSHQSSSGSKSSKENNNNAMFTANSDDLSRQKNETLPQFDGMNSIDMGFFEYVKIEPREENNVEEVGLSNSLENFSLGSSWAAEPQLEKITSIVKREPCPDDGPPKLLAFNIESPAPIKQKRQYRKSSKRAAVTEQQEPKLWELKTPKREPFSLIKTDQGRFTHANDIVSPQKVNQTPKVQASGLLNLKMKKVLNLEMPTLTYERIPPVKLIVKRAKSGKILEVKSKNPIESSENRGPIKLYIKMGSDGKPVSSRLL